MSHILHEVEAVVGDFFIPAEHVFVGPELGRGAFGVVFEGSFRGSPCAVKKVLYPPKTRQDIDDLIKEMKLMKLLPHRRMVQFYGVVVKDGDYWIITELMEKKSLREHLVARKFAPLPADEIARIGMQVAEGLVFLHGAGVLHRDLKPQNILLDEYGNAKICDLGLARAMTGAHQCNVAAPGSGTPAYMSPEQMNSRTLTEKCDTYGLGMVMLEVSTGQFPWGSMDVDTIINTVSRRHEKPKILNLVPECLRDIVSSCLEANPEMRPSAQQLKQRLQDLWDELRTNMVTSAISEDYVVLSDSVHDEAKMLAPKTSPRKAGFFTNLLNFSMHNKPEQEPVIGEPSELKLVFHIGREDIQAAGGVAMQAQS